MMSSIYDKKVKNQRSIVCIFFVFKLKMDVGTSYWPCVKKYGSLNSSNYVTEKRFSERYFI